MTPIGFGQSDIVKGWDPAKGIARCVRVVSAGDDSGGTFTINGYDLYGYPLTQTLTGAAAGTATTTKAFKYIASIVPAGTLSGSAVTVGTTDTIGLPLRADYFSEIEVWWNNAQVTATTGFTAAVTTDPSTATTGDVRGTYALQSAASNGTLRLTVYVTLRWRTSSLRPAFSASLRSEDQRRRGYPASSLPTKDHSHGEKAQGRGGCPGAGRRCPGQSRGHRYGGRGSEDRSRRGAHGRRS